MLQCGRFQTSLGTCSPFSHRDKENAYCHGGNCQGGKQLGKEQDQDKQQSEYPRSDLQDLALEKPHPGENPDGRIGDEKSVGQRNHELHPDQPTGINGQHQGMPDRVEKDPCSRRAVTVPA